MGTSFENLLFQEICDQAKVKKLQTTAYHPQTNGQCERFNKTLIRMIGTLSVSHKQNWQEWIPILVHAYNCSTSSVTGFSPYFLIYGRQPKLPIDIEYGVTLDESYNDCKSYADKLQHRLKWAYEAPQKSIDKESARFKRYYYKKYKCASLQEGDLVLICVVKPGARSFSCGRSTCYSGTAEPDLRLGQPPRPPVPRIPLRKVLRPVTHKQDVRIVDKVYC